MGTLPLTNTPQNHLPLTNTSQNPFTPHQYQNPFTPHQTSQNPVSPSPTPRRILFPHHQHLTESSFPLTNTSQNPVSPSPTPHRIYLPLDEMKHLLNEKKHFDKSPCISQIINDMKIIERKLHSCIRNENRYLRNSLLCLSITKITPCDPQITPCDHKSPLVTH